MGLYSLGEYLEDKLDKWADCEVISIGGKWLELNFDGDRYFIKKKHDKYKIYDKHGDFIDDAYGKKDVKYTILAFTHKIYDA